MSAWRWLRVMRELHRATGGAVSLAAGAVEVIAILAAMLAAGAAGFLAMRWFVRR